MYFPIFLIINVFIWKLVIPVAQKTGLSLVHYFCWRRGTWIWDYILIQQILKKIKCTQHASKILLMLIFAQNSQNQARNMWHLKHKFHLIYRHYKWMISLRNSLSDLIVIWYFLKCTYSYGDTLKINQFFCLISSYD